MTKSEKPHQQFVNPKHKEDEELEAELAEKFRPRKGQKIHTADRQLTVDYVEGGVVLTAENPMYPIPLTNLRPHPTRQNEWIVDPSAP
jgi:hypothetical protein